jgi:hypothetical protein
MADNEPAIVDHLAKTVFALSPEDIEALETSVVDTVPKLLAKVFVKANQNMFAQLSKTVPLMVQRHMEDTKRRTTSETGFYSRWPDLKPDVHGNLINRLAATYRELNPSVPTAQMIEELGPLAMLTAKVVPKAPGAPVTNGVRPPSAPPFVPALAGTAAIVQQVEGNPWDILAPDAGEQQ